MSYWPSPIDTTGISLPPELEALAERLAEDGHDLWAAQRRAEGWTYGPQRDDGRKQHPCLVPYEQLSESEKEFDRVSAMRTVKVVLWLGYWIVPPTVDDVGS